MWGVAILLSRLLLISVSFSHVSKVTLLELCVLLVEGVDDWVLSCLENLGLISNVSSFLFPSSYLWSSWSCKRSSSLTLILQEGGASNVWDLVLQTLSSSSKLSKFAELFELCVELKELELFELDLFSGSSMMIDGKCRPWLIGLLNFSEFITFFVVLIPICPVSCWNEVESHGEFNRQLRDLQLDFSIFLPWLSGNSMSNLFNFPFLCGSIFTWR